MPALEIRVRGQVQGVGFRPFVWQLAQRFELVGEVLNDPEGVLIHVVGHDLDAFLAALQADAPPLSRIDRVEVADWPVQDLPADFEIAPSLGRGGDTRVTPDAATCQACLDDLHSTDARRGGYAFNNCTHCGPRFTIISGLPYDRARTSMAAFEMCSDCAREYQDPRDRRFHAQPVACHRCGPQLAFETRKGAQSGDPIALATQALREGAILAVKGLGGFHLCCDGTNPVAIALLRERKRRPVKPLAIMDHLSRIESYAHLLPDARARLEDPAAPILLLPRKPQALPDVLAPGLDEIGVMLPYTPLHHLLLDAMDGPLVMTSGNLSGEPQVIANDEARLKLAGLVDGYLMHNRDILRRLDDSVERMTVAGPMILRRARGQVPATLDLPEGFEAAPEVAAFGGHLKSALCLTKNGQALLSHHLGDLDELLTWEEFVKADRDYAALFDHTPQVFACDLHVGYPSSMHAQTRARAAQAPLIEVQHHHAHLAACLAENRWPLDDGPVAAIVLDGLGLGSDGTIWGGEVLLGDYRRFERAAWLVPVPLVGGDAAQREPWRNAVMRLDRAGLEHKALRCFPDHPVALIRQAGRAGVNAVPSSSAGRLFDAFAAVLGISAGAQSFEGEAAMLLEARARKASGDAMTCAYAFGAEQKGGAMDDRALWAAWFKDHEAGVSSESMALRFHAGLATSFAAQARQLVEAGSAKAVVLSGGCFQNALLLELTLEALEGLPVLTHTKIPANDGGLALGQAVIAAARSLEPEMR